MLVMMLSKMLPMPIFAQVMSQIESMQEAGEDPTPMLLQLCARVMAAGNERRQESDSEEDAGGDVVAYDENADDDDDDDHNDDHDGVEDGGGSRRRPTKEKANVQMRRFAPWRELAAHDVIALVPGADDSSAEADEYVQMIVSVIGDGNASSAYVPYSDGVGTGFHLELVQDDVPLSARVMFGAMISDMHRASRSISPGMFNGVHMPAIMGADLDLLNRNLNSVKRWWPHAFHVVTDADKAVLEEMDDDLRRNDDAIGLASALGTFVTNLRCQLSYHANPLRTSVPLPSYVLLQRNRMLVLYAILGACDMLRGVAAGRPKVGAGEAMRGQQAPLVNVAVSTLAALLRMPMCETPALMPPQVAESVIDALKAAVAKVSLLAFSRTSPDNRDNNSEALLRSACAWLRRFLAPSAALPASVRGKALDALLLISMRSGTLNDYVAMIYYLLMPAEAARFIDMSSDAAAAPLPGSTDFGAALPASALALTSDAGFAGLPRNEQLFPLSADVTVQLSAFANFHPGGRSSLKIPPVFLCTASFPPPRAPVLEATRTMACDGATLFVHDHHGLRKIGTGYCGTERGKVYARVTDFLVDEKVYLALAHQLLFCSTATAPNSVLILSPSTLEVLNADRPLELPLSERSKSATSGDSALLYSHLTSDSRELFAVRYNRETSVMFVDQFCPLAVVAAYAQAEIADSDDDNSTKGLAAQLQRSAARFVLTKSIVVSKSTKITDADFEVFARTRFVHAQVVVDYDRLVAVVPLPDASSLLTTSHRWELGGTKWMATVEGDNDRDLYTIALDHHNSLLWTYLPLGDFLAGYSWWMVRHHCVTPFARAELAAPFVTVQGEVDADGKALEYDFVSSCQHVSYAELIAANSQLSIGFAGGASGAFVPPTPADDKRPPSPVTPIAREGGNAPTPRALTCSLFTGDAVLLRVERASSAAAAALASNTRCDHCHEPVLLPTDAPLRAPPATDADERGLASDGVRREPQKPTDFFWQEAARDESAAAAPRAICDLCVMNVKPVKHAAHEHPLVARLPNQRLKEGYHEGWVCDLCRQSFLAHDADMMHHCAEGCSFDLCSRCFWGDRATRAQAALALCHIAADQAVDVRARLAELRPSIPLFDARAPKRSAVEPTNVVVAQLADLLELTLARYLASAAASRAAFAVSDSHRELQFQLFVIKSVVQLIKANLFELTHCQVGALDGGLRQRIIALLVGRLLAPLIDGDLVVAPVLATFAFDVLECVLLGFRTLYPTASEQIDAIALLAKLADAPYFNPFAIGECASMRAPRGPIWLRARADMEQRPRNQWVLRMLTDTLNNTDISSWFAPAADAKKAKSPLTSSTTVPATQSLSGSSESIAAPPADGDDASAATAAAAAATSSGSGGGDDDEVVQSEPLRANLRALLVDLVTGHPGELPMLPERSCLAFAIQKQLAAAAMHGSVRPFETALCNYADIMLAAARDALQAEGFDFNSNLRHNALSRSMVPTLLPHFIAAVGSLVVTMSLSNAVVMADKMRLLCAGLTSVLASNPEALEAHRNFAVGRVTLGTPNFKWLRHGVSVIGTHERVIVPHVQLRVLDLYENSMWVAARVYTQLVSGSNRTPAEQQCSATLALELFSNALDKSTRPVLQCLRNGELSGPRDMVDAEHEFLLRLAGLNRRPRSSHLLFAAVRAATAPPRTRAQLMAALSVAVASDTDDDDASTDAAAIHPLDRIERGVVAVLLKHLALTTLAMQHAASLRASKGDANGADFSALADVWQQAQRFKVWVMQQSQTLASSDGGVSDSETGGSAGGAADSGSEATPRAASQSGSAASSTATAAATASDATNRRPAADPVRAFLDTITARIALLLHVRAMAVPNAEPAVDVATAPTAATKRWRGAVSKLAGRGRLVASAMSRMTSDGADDDDVDDGEGGAAASSKATADAASTPTAAATTDQAASRWNVFFGVWKKRRRLQRSPALSEKLTSEVISFLKESPPVDVLFAAMERRIERAEQRAQGLRGFAELFRSSIIDGAMIQVIPCVISAFRGDAILAQTESTLFRVLGGLDGCGGDLTQPVSAAYHELLRLMVEYAQRDLPAVLVTAVIDTLNVGVTPADEDALVDMGLVPWLLKLARESRSNDSVGGCAWKLLRILLHESARTGTPKVVAQAGVPAEDEDVPVHVRGACALAASAINPLLDELTESVQAIRPLKVGSANWHASDEPIAQELLVLCSYRTPAMLPLLARPRTVHVLFDAMRFGALRTKLIAMRLLREVLPLTSPGALAAYEAKRLSAAAIKLSEATSAGVESDDDSPADEMRVMGLGVVGALLEVIGITFEASSTHCARAIRRLVQVATAHDVFAVANAAVAVVRALVIAPLWSERIRAVLMEALANVPALLARTGGDGGGGGGGGGAMALRASMTTLTDDHESVWAAVAALYVLGGSWESLHLGGRVLVLPNESADRIVYHSMLHGCVTNLSDAHAHVAIEDSLVDMLRIPLAFVVPLPEVLLPSSLLPTVQAVMPLLSMFVGSRAVASTRGPLRTLYYQFRTAAMRMLLTLCVARPDAVIDSGLLTSVAQLAINGVAERVRYRDADGGSVAPTIDASVEQLHTLAQSLHELLLGDKETAIVTLRIESRLSNLAEQRKKLVTSLVPPHKLGELLRTFAVVDLNGDGELTINEIISAQNLYSGPNADRDAELRVLYERIDTEKKGSIDFFQFVIMTQGLEGYAFDADDAADNGGEARKPLLVVNAPVGVAGSSDARMSKHGKQLTEDVRGPLRAHANGGEFDQSLVLIEAMVEDAAPLAERVADAVARGAKAVLVAVEKLDAINVDDLEAMPFIELSPVPIAFIACATSQRVLSAVDGGYSEPEGRDMLRDSTSLQDLAAAESAQTVAALRVLGMADQFDEADVADLVREFGSVTGAIGALLSRRSRQGLLQSTSFDDFQQGAIAFAKRSLSAVMSSNALAQLADEDADNAGDREAADEEEDDDDDDDRESDGGCFACGAPDHIARECPEVIGEEAAAAAAAARLRARHSSSAAPASGQQRQQRAGGDGDESESESDDGKAKEGAPTYLSSFLRSGGAPATEVAHKLFVDVSKVRSSVVRVERDLATHHALQAVLALLARWPAKAERSLLALGLSASQFVALLRAATDPAAAPPPALRDSLLHGSVSQWQGGGVASGRSSAADDVAHIAMHHLPIGAIAPFVLDVLRREPQALSTTLFEIAGTLALEAKLAEGASAPADEAKAHLQRELSAHANIEFALSMLDLLSADPSLDTSPLLHIGTLDALLRCVRFSAPQHRLHASNALLRVVRQLRQAGKSDLPTAALREHVRILHSMLQESHAADMRVSDVVLSVMSQRYAQLISEFELLAAPVEAVKTMFDPKVAERQGSHVDDPSELFGVEELERDSCSIENNVECEILRQSFPSVGSRRWVTSGKWMYEAHVYSECAQIGWANERFRSNIARGEGVGDDAESWAYDGLRQRKWHRGWGAYGERWKEGDIVSCYLDLDAGVMTFALNGKSMGVAYTGIKADGRGLRAAASFDSKLVFNLGHSPFEAPLSGYKPIDDMDTLYRADLEAFSRLYYITDLFAKRDAAERAATAAAAASTTSGSGVARKSPTSAEVLLSTPAATLVMHADSPTVLSGTRGAASGSAVSSAAPVEDSNSPFAIINTAALTAAAAAESTCSFDIATTATVNGTVHASLTDPTAPSAGAPILYENCVVVLRDKAGTAFSPRSIYIESQRRRFTTQCPLRVGLVFVFSDELSDQEVTDKLRRFDSLDETARERLARGAGIDENEPIATFEIEDSVSTTVEFAERTRVGRCVALKLLNGGRSTHRVDMSLVRVRGTPGPFAKSQSWVAPRVSALAPDYRPISSIWTRAHDVALVRYLVDLADHHKLESPVHVTQGMVLCSLPTADRYPLLAAVDQNSLLARMHLMSYINVQIYRALTWIDLSAGDESRAVLRDATSNVPVVGVPTTAARGAAESAPTRAVPSADSNLFGDLFRSVRALMYPTTKARLLNGVLDSSAQAAADEKPDVVLNRVMAHRAQDATDQHAARRTLLGQTYRQLTTAPRSVFLSRQQGWRVFFAGEGGQDVGGLFREQLDEVCRELQSSSALQLFVQSANGQHSVGDGRETWLPRASATSPLQLDLFEFVGRLIGVAVRTKNNLNVNFSSILYKFLVGEVTNLRDLRGVDAMTVQSLEALRTINEQGVSDDSFEDVFTETFTTNASDGGEVELVPGGKSLQVTAANRLQFATLVERFRLRESWQQLLAIRIGLGFVIPLTALSIYTWRELKLLVEGRATVDIELLKQHTVFRNGFSARHRVIQLFWRALESFSDTERQMFLRFAWGRSRLPPPAQLASSPLKVALLDTPRPDDTLPQAHTCFFAIDLPAYTSYEACRSKLLYACTNAVAYDSDFNVQNADNWS